MLQSKINGKKVQYGKNRRGNGTHKTVQHIPNRNKKGQFSNQQTVQKQPVNLDPFDSSPANRPIEFLKSHGPAIAKITFLLATAAETTYAGMHMLSEPNGWTIAMMIWGCGFILECCFAYSWVMEGSPKLAGDQVGINKRVHNTSSLIMLGGLITMLLSSQVEAAHVVFIGWTSIVVPLGAVWLMHQLYVLKGAHPETIARNELITTQAKGKAAWIREQRKQQKLSILQTEAAQYAERRELEIALEEERRIIESPAYRRKMRKKAKRKIHG